MGGQGQHEPQVGRVLIKERRQCHVEKNRRHGEENLIPFNERTEEEQREIRRQGGIASGESRRRRKTLKEELELLLESGDWQERISTAMLEKAASGSERAFEVIRDTIGEKPTDKFGFEDGSNVKFVFSNFEDDSING